MIYINSKKIDNLKHVKDYAVITDFDWTLSTVTSQTSMGIVPDYIGGELLKKRKEIFEYYHPIELDYTIPDDEKSKLMKEWARKSFSLLSEYITEDIIINATKSAKTYLRSGTKEFLKSLYEKNIPVIVMSAGIGNVIKNFLKKEEILFDNVTVVANIFEFKNKKPILDLENIVYTSNKNYYNIPENIRNIIEEKEKIILFGDVIEDLKMINKEQLNKTITCGFLDKNIESNLNVFNENFDIVLTENKDFNSIKDIIM